MYVRKSFNAKVKGIWLFLGSAKLRRVDLFDETYLRVTGSHLPYGIRQSMHIYLKNNPANFTRSDLKRPMLVLFFEEVVSS